MILPITSLTALALAPVLVVLTVNVIRSRVALKVSLGDGGDTGLLERIRSHGNFVEWVPISLILLALAEASNAPATMLYAGAAMLVAARLMHPFGIDNANPFNRLRIVGATANLIAVIIFAVAIILTLRGR